MKTIARYISILLGLLYCLFILWNRVLRTRHPIDLFLEYTIFRICIYITLLLLSIIVFFYYLRKIANIPPKRFVRYLLEKAWVISIIHWVTEYILNAPKNLYEWLYERIKIRPFIESLNVIIYNHGLSDSYLSNIILMLMISFHPILCLVFLHGVFSLHQLTYFYKGLIFLLIPLCFRILLFSIDHLSRINKAYIERLILFESNETQDGWIMSRQDENDLELTEEDMEYHAEIRLLYIYSIMTIDYYNSKEQKIKPYINAFCYGFYAIGWGYILYRIYLNEYGLF